MAAVNISKQPIKLFWDPSMVGPKISMTPPIPKTKPNNLFRFRFSSAMKKCAKINVISGIIAINNPAIPEVT
jgi:hypothetical protein